MMVDRYPVPWQPLAVASAQWRLGRLTAGRTKPFIAVLQAFDWNAHAEMLPGETNLRPPTHTELRCMVYQALAQGADGLFFYAWESGSWKLREHPATWTALQQVIGEVNDRRGLFKPSRSGGRAPTNSARARTASTPPRTPASRPSSCASRPRAAPCPSAIICCV